MNELIRLNTSWKYLDIYNDVNLSYNLKHSLNVLIKSSEITSFVLCFWLNLQDITLTDKWFAWNVNLWQCKLDYHYIWCSHWLLQQVWFLSAQQINNMLSCSWQAHIKQQDHWSTVSHFFQEEDDHWICFIYVQTWFFYFCQTSQYYNVYHQASAFLHFLNSYNQW